ncbi:MAG: methylmalonyl-CoA epimerase, partial [Elusimicrobiota bacterium]
MFKQIFHLGIAVRNIEESLKLYHDIFKMEFSGIEELPQAGVKVALLKIGETRLELLEALSPESPIAKFIEKHGPGFHHIAYRVEDIEKAISVLKNSGCTLLDDKPRQGAHNTRIAFIHP